MLVEHSNWKDPKAQIVDMLCSILRQGSRNSDGSEMYSKHSDQNPNLMVLVCIVIVSVLVSNGLASACESVLRLGHVTQMHVDQRVGLRWTGGLAVGLGRWIENGPGQTSGSSDRVSCISRTDQTGFRAFPTNGAVACLTLAGSDQCSEISARWHGG